MNRLVQLWRWEPRGLAPFETVRARGMWRVLLLLIPVIAASTLVQLLGDPMWVAALPAGFTLNYLLAAWLLRRGSQQAAAWTIVGVGLVALPGLLVVLGGIEGTAPFYFQVAGMLGVLWLERRAATAVAAALMAILVSAPLWVPTSYSAYTDGPTFQFAMMVSGVMAVTMMSSVAGSTVDALQTANADATNRAREANTLADAAIRASQAKTRFLSMMSHELRTPLNAIVGYADLLGEEEGAGPRRQLLDRIGASGMRLLDLVDAVLENTRSFGDSLVSSTPLPETDDLATLRDQMIRRTVQVLLLGSVVGTVFRTFGPEGMSNLPRSLPYFALLAAGLVLAETGRARIAGWFVAVVGLSWLLYGVAVGGPSVREVPYVLVTVTAAWTWLGRTAGIVAVLAADLTFAASWALGREPAVTHEPWSWAATHTIAVLLAVLFLRAVTTELRAATLRARDAALAAEAAATAARDADDARDRFLAEVNEALREPLTVALTDAAALRDEEDDPVRRADLDRIRDAGLQLMKLIDDVLDMRRLRRGELVLRREAVDLGPLLDDAVTTVARGAQAYGDRISVRVPLELPVVEGDGLRIRQIVTNLLSNSIKHTRCGEIVVDVTSAGGELRVAVQDQGTGIPCERLSEVFEPFVQLQDGPDRQPGIGLGLALSQLLARGLGGRIEASSRPGSGSTFTLALPVHHVGTPDASARGMR